jgi:predicted transcriptional regulator
MKNIDVPQPNIEKVIAALEDARFKWRTIKGIAGQTGLGLEEVSQALAVLIDSGLVIRSTIPSADGEDLYTTRTHYKHYTPLSERLSAAFRNRAT